MVGVGTAPYLASYGITTQLITVAAPLNGQAETINLAEIIPIIKVGEKELTCAATKDYFGDQNYDEGLTKCAA